MQKVMIDGVEYVPKSITKFKTTGKLEATKADKGFCICSDCGSPSLDYHYAADCTVWRVIQCNSCHAIFTGRKSNG